MPINNQSLNKELYKMLKVRGFDPVPKDSTGETSPVPDEADVFKFTFKSGEESKGTAYATIDGDNELTLYYGDDVTKKINEEDGTESFDLSWTGFLKNMKMWAQRHQMGFELQNKDHLHSDMAQRNYTKKQENMSESAYQQPLQGQDMDKLNEGYFPNGKLSSYNDNIPTVKIVLQHTRQIQEGEQRYRNVARIYLENLQGERILAPTIKPGIAQIYARHLAEGGVPNDERWNHIKSLCEEYSKMAGFVRAVRGNQFNESAQRLVEAGLNHYTNLRETLGKMRGQRGYNAYFESWTPTLMENEGDENTLNELFVQETLDPRIESVMPILQKLSKSISEVKEIKELEEWADKLTEAPGAETLAHNQSTAKSNLKAFDLEEDSVNEGWFADTLRNVGQSVLNRLAPNDKQLLLKLQRDMGVPTTAQHGKPSMARTMSDEEVQKLIAAARKVNAGRNSSLSEEEVEESGLQAYLGNKKYGKKGMDALRKAGRDGASKEKMAKIRAKYDKLDEQGVAEGFSDVVKGVKRSLKGKEHPDVVASKHAGRAIGHYNQGDIAAGDKETERYKKIRNMHLKAKGVAEGSSDDLVYISVDRVEAFEDWMDSEGLETNVPKTDEGTYVVYDYSNADYRSKMYASDWNEKKGVTEGFDSDTQRLEQDVRDALENGDDYTAKQYAKMASTPEAKKYLLNIIKQAMYSDEERVAETKVDNYKDMGATKDTTHFVKNMTTGKIVSPHRSKQDAEDALIANMRDSKDEFKIVRARKESVEEDLDANQTRVGQLGPTEKVGPKGAVGKLVGANESVEHDPLQDIKRLLGK